MSSPGPREVYISALAVGDCLSQKVTTNTGSVFVVPCDQAHEGEVFAVTRLTDGSYPGMNAVKAKAKTFCREAFREFVGINASRSKLVLTGIYPSEDREGTDLTVQCVVSATEKTVGTLRGAKR